MTVFFQAGPVLIRRMNILLNHTFSATREVILDTATNHLDAAIAGEQTGPLTDRELELLLLLPTCLTNAELAERFFVSVNTVKTHMTHIYRKLGVSNRSGAIIRATQLGLLKNPTSAAQSNR